MYQHPDFKTVEKGAKKLYLKKLFAKTLIKCNKSAKTRKFLYFFGGLLLLFEWLLNQHKIQFFPPR
jgi:hypothetical protein